MQYDFLIVGAGLAGSACARLLAQAGARVLVVDRADLQKKDKLCGGLLTPRAVRELEALYGDGVAGLYRENHSEMRVLFGSHDHVLQGVCVRGTWRRDVDRYVLEQAEAADVDLWDNARICAIDFQRRQARVIRRPGEECTVDYGALVAADGANSWVRREAIRQRATADGPRFARLCPADLVPSLEAYVEPSGQILTGKYCAHLRGYGWYVPCGAGANIGFDAAPGTTPQALRAELDTFAQEMGVSLDEGRLRGAFIPSGNSVLLELPGYATFFVGDAAGLAAPATGEGIYFALRSAHLLARALTSGVASYRSLVSGEAAVLERQHAMLGMLFDERIMESVVSISHVTGIGSGRAARFALRLFASF